MFDKVNLERALANERQMQEENGENQILSQFKTLFEAEWENKRRVLQTIGQGVTSSRLPDPENLPVDKIYDLNSIKGLCIKYRLRFLSTKQFKGEIPDAVLASVTKTEKLIGHKIDAFMIAAPAELFKLEDVNKDPLLFAPLRDGRYYLVDQWGKDMAWYRSLLTWPARAPLNLLLFIVALSAIFAVLIPSNLLSQDESTIRVMRVAAFVWNVIFLSGITSYIWFSSYAKFSVHAWQSKTFN